MFIVDPTDKEESLCLSSVKKGKPDNHGIIMQAMLSQHDQISEFFLVGSMDVNFINTSMNTLSKISNEIYPILQQSLRKSIIKMIKRKKEGDE
jgi:hypothetical protein